jgi:hypothetical protein
MTHLYCAGQVELDFDPFSVIHAWSQLAGRKATLWFRVRQISTSENDGRFSAEKRGGSCSVYLTEFLVAHWRL